MNKLKLLITQEDTWTSAEGEIEGKVFLLRFRPHLQDFILTTKYNKRFTVSWDYASENNSLMPSENEIELMEKIETTMVDILENDLQAILSFVYLGQKQKEWQWYSTDIPETEKRLTKVFSQFGTLPIKISYQDDPEWNEYKAILARAEDSESQRQ